MWCFHICVINYQVNNILRISIGYGSYPSIFPLRDSDNAMELSPTPDKLLPLHLLAVYRDFPLISLRLTHLIQFRPHYEERESAPSNTVSLVYLCCPIFLLFVSFYLFSYELNEPGFLRLFTFLYLNVFDMCFVLRRFLVNFFHLKFLIFNLLLSEHTLRQNYESPFRTYFVSFREILQLFFLESKGW